MSDLPGRLLRLLSLLQSRREWSGAELAERLGVTDRTVRRDIGRLRSLDYPVTGTTGTSGGYQLAAGRNLPPLALSDDEAVAVAVGLAGAAGSGVGGLEDSSVSALAKLTQVLPARLRPQLDAVGASTVIGRADLPPLDPVRLAALAACCRDREVVAFDYDSRAGDRTGRRVEPQHLVAELGQWYLIAFDLDRDDWRTFRVERITDLRPTRHRFDARELPAADPVTYLTESFARATYRHTVTLRVEIDADTLRQSFYGWWLPGTVEPTGPGTCVVRLSADSNQLLMQFLAGIVTLGAPFTLEATEPTAALIRRVSARLLAAT